MTSRKFSTLFLYFIIITEVFQKSCKFLSSICGFKSSFPLFWKSLSLHYNNSNISNVLWTETIYIYVDNIKRTSPSSIFRMLLDQLTLFTDVTSFSIIRLRYHFLLPLRLYSILQFTFRKFIPPLFSSQPPLKREETQEQKKPTVQSIYPIKFICFGLVMPTQFWPQWHQIYN